MKTSPKIIENYIPIERNKPKKSPKTIKELAYKFWYNGPSYVSVEHYEKLANAAIKFSRKNKC